MSKRMSNLFIICGDQGIPLDVLKKESTYAQWTTVKIYTARALLMDLSKWKGHGPNDITKCIPKDKLWTFPKEHLSQYKNSHHKKIITSVAKSYQNNQQKIQQNHQQDHQQNHQIIRQQCHQQGRQQNHQQNHQQYHQQCHRQCINKTINKTSNSAINNKSFFKNVDIEDSLTTIMMSH